MAGINKVILIGNLGRDPEIRYTQGGQAVCRLNLATTRSWLNRQTNERSEETEWHRVTVWGKQAEHCNNYLAKGRSCYVEGRLRTSSYEDKEGVKRYSTEIVAETVQFLGGRGEGASGPGGGGNPPGGGAPQAGGYASGGDGGFGGGGGGGAGGGGYGGGGGGGQPSGGPSGGFGGDSMPPGPEDDDIPF